MRSRILNIIFPEILFENMDSAAKASYISRSAYIREAVAEKLNRERAGEQAADAVQTNNLEEIDWQRLIDQGD